nr:DUF5958 family protein [Streptomyces abikoensis]
MKNSLPRNAFSTSSRRVLMVREPVMYQGGQIASLPSYEYMKAFRVLISTFSIADTRRRETECRGQCGHSWHNLT